MALLGLDPASPRPGVHREYVPAAGPSSGIADSRSIIIVGNKTAGGTETVDAVSDDFIVDDADAKARLGLRSEAYAMYRQVTAVPQDANIYVCCPTESAGAKAKIPFLVSGTADTSTTWEFHCHGETFTYSCVSGDTAQVTAQAISAVANAHDEGRLQVVSTEAVNAGNWDVFFEYSQNGDRGDLVVAAATTRGIRVRILSGPGNAQTIVKTTGSYVSGGATDDWSTAITAISAGEYYYHISAKHQVAALIATDNGNGEYLTMVNTQALPVNGKDQRLMSGLVGTQAEATTSVTGAAGNSVWGHFFHQENSDWSPAMLAAHCGAVVRQNEIAHPAANVNGWQASTTQVFNVPVPFVTTDRPTNAEIVADLNNGITPLSWVNGRVVLERFITSRSLNSSASNDYRAREGHIPSVLHFCWSILRQRFESIRQPFADDDPEGVTPPAARTLIPSTIKALIFSLLDEFTGSSPQSGTYTGPILKPSALQEMKDSVRVTYAGGGAFDTEIDFQAVEHDIKWSVKVRETGDAY